MAQRSSMYYDAIGNVIETVDFNGNHITYDYDATNRLTTKHFLAEGLTTQYTYTLTGRRETVTDSRGTISYRYNEQG